MSREAQADAPGTRTTGQTSTERYGYVIAGAGHNSLITAAYLSRAGYHVLALEAQNQNGGCCRTNDTMLAGFHEDWCSSVHGFNRNPALARNELQLDRYGCEQMHPDVVLYYPFLDGASFTVFKNDPERTAETIV